MHHTAAALRVVVALTLLRLNYIPQQRWLEAFNHSEGELRLDLSHVAEIDTAGLQLLWLLRREARAAGRALNIVAVSPAVADLLAFCRLTGDFAAPVVAEPAVEAA